MTQHWTFRHNGRVFLRAHVDRIEFRRAWWHEASEYAAYAVIAGSLCVILFTILLAGGGA
jgi:hypothetical protein